MICNRCGTEYNGNQCSCVVKKKYRKEEGESEKISTHDSKHRDNFMHFVKLLNEFKHWEKCADYVDNPVFNELKSKTLLKIEAFRRAQGRFFEDMIKCPWFWKCHNHGCEKWGTMSTLGNADVPRYCETHFIA